MSNILKKIAVVGISVSMMVWLLGFTPAKAATIEELQAQIAALLAQITALQTQLGAAQGPAKSVPSIASDLTIGSKGDDVKSLQNFLISENKGSVAAALAKVGATGYFGSMTKAALKEYQAAVGISPSTGYFGSKTRAYLASIAAAPGPTPSPTPTPTSTSVPAGTIAASLATDSPSGSAIAGAGQIDSLKFKLTGSGTATALEFTKIGVVSDTSISNLYLADENGKVIAQFSSLSNGVAKFDSLSIAVSGVGTTLVLRTDLSSSASAGNTLAWKLTKVTAGDLTVSGLPVSGNTLTVTTVSNPSIATATFTFNSVGSTVDAGTNGVLVANVTANIGNSAVDLKNMKFSVVGSANTAHLKNLQLKVNGVQAGSTLDSVASDGTAVFNLASAPVRLNTGNSTVELYADITGSPNRTAQFTILRPYDVHVVDTQYNVGISPTVTTTNATQITINQGQITVQLATDTPTGNIPIGASNITLAKFNIYASGEPVKVKFLDATITRSGGSEAWDSSTIATVTDDLQNIKLIDDAGSQIGSTISTVAHGSSNNQCTVAATTLTCHFGTSSSNINYTIPANTTRTISLVVDILSTLDSATSLRGSLPGNTSNLEGQISFQGANSGTSNGSTLTVVTTPLTVAANSAFSTPTYVAGALNQRIASFVITASSAEGAKISSLSFDKDSNANLDLQSLKVMVGSSQFGATKPTVSDAETSMTFSGSTSLNVPKGGSIIVDVFADILTSSATGTQSAVIDLTGWSALGATSQSSISFPGAVSGQNVSISSGATLTVAAGSNTAAAKQVVMGSANNSLFSVRLTNNNIEDVKITDLKFTDTIGAADTVASFEGLALFDGSTQVGGPLSLTHTSGSTTSTVTFSFTTPVIVSKNNSKTLELKGGVASFTSGGATSNSSHTFGVAATADVTSLGKDSNSSVTVSGTPSGNAQTVIRTKLRLTSTTLATGTQSRIANLDLGKINWSADSADQLTIGTVTIKFSGLAVSGATNFSVSLLKNDNTAFGSASAQTCTPSSGNSCSVTFGPQFVLSTGDNIDSKVRIAADSLADVNAQGTEALSVVINGASDVLWNDGSTAGLGLEASTVPFTVANIVFN